MEAKNKEIEQIIKNEVFNVNFRGCRYFIISVTRYLRN